MKTAKQNKIGSGFSRCCGALLWHISDRRSAALKNIVCGLLILGLIFWLSGGVSACCDVGNGTCYTCGDTIYASCTLNADLTSTGTCFTVGTNGVTINGKVYAITGDMSGYGIRLNGISGVTIQNTKITNFSYGIYLNSNADNNKIVNNTGYNNSYGIYVVTSSNNTINNNGYYDNAIGIRLTSSDDNNITNNTVNNNSLGIYIEYSSYNLVSNNSVNSNNCSGILVDGQGCFSHNNITGNEVHYNGFGSGCSSFCGTQDPR